MSDPMTVTDRQLRAAYEALGLDPDRYEQVRRIDIHKGTVTVVRVREDEKGTLVLPDGTDVLTETITLAVELPDFEPTSG